MHSSPPSNGNVNIYNSYNLIFVWKDTIELSSTSQKKNVPDMYFPRCSDINFFNLH